MVTGPISHTFAAALYLEGAWSALDVSEILGQIETRRGYTEENTLKPAELSWTFRDDAGNYDPDNPESTLYGQIGRNTPVRVSVDGDMDTVAEITTWEPDETDDFTVGPPLRGVRSMAISAGGLMRRISSWTQLTQSAMRQSISGYSTLVGYFPLEQGRDSTQLSNVVTGGKPGYAYDGVTFDVEDCPQGAASCIEVDAAARFGGQFLTMSSTGGWQLAWSADLSSVTLGGSDAALLRWRTSNGYQWYWGVSSGAYRFTVIASDGTVLHDSSNGFGAGAEPGQWITTRCKVSASGGTVTAEISWYAQGGISLYGISPTFSGTVGRPTSWSGGVLDGARLCHVFAVSGIADDLLSSQAVRAFDGYAGETTWDRFGRLCALFGIDYLRQGVESGCTLMGPQPLNTLWDHFKEIAATEDGLIFDARTSLAVVFRTRRSRINQTAALELTYPDHIASPFRKIIGNLGVGNTVTVTQVNGGEATAALTSGPMAPDQIGEVKRGVDVNVSDETQLPILAAYWLNRYAVQGARYGSVTIDCDANPAIASDAATVEIGDLITIDGYGFDQLLLIVIGVATSSYNDRRKIVLTTVPADVAQAAVYGTGRYDLRACTLGTGPLSGGYWSSSATALTVNTPGAKWSTTEEPYDLLISGEVVTVTSAAAATTTQVLTVTRHGNGVVKQLPGGAEVHIAPPARLRQ